MTVAMMLSSVVDVAAKNLEPAPWAITKLKLKLQR